MDGVTKLGLETSFPLLTIFLKLASRETSHCTGIARLSKPPPFNGSGASLVHKTTPSGSGSPEAIPKVKGYSILLD